MAEESEIDYSLNNPDTLTKYKTAAQIAQKALQAVTSWCVEDAVILSLCEKGDKLLEEETGKVYKGKKISKGICHPTTVSPTTVITPYTPLQSDAEEAAITLKAGDIIKIQLGAHIDGFAAIVCDTVVVAQKEDSKDAISKDHEANLLLAAHYANELLLRVMIPPGLLSAGSEEEKEKSSGEKPISQAKITNLLHKVVESYGCNLVESTTCWLFERNEIEGKKKIVLAPGEGVKGEGSPDVGEVWGVEIGVTTGSGKVKTLEYRPTLHRRTATKYALKRQSSRQTLSEVAKKFGNFPFSLRQLDDERAAKMGVVECVRGNVLRQYEVVGDRDGAPVARLFTTIAITKNGIARLAAPPEADVKQLESQTDKKITDEEILKLLEQPVSRAGTGKSKNKKKKKKKSAKKESAAEDEDSSDEE